MCSFLYKRRSGKGIRILLQSREIRLSLCDAHGWVSCCSRETVMHKPALRFITVIVIRYVSNRIRCPIERR
jgi:hypothetical protein